MNVCLGDNVELLPNFFFFFFTGIGGPLWVGVGRQRMLRKTRSQRGLSHCFVFVFLVCKYTSVHYSLSDLKLDVYVFFVDWFFGSKRVYLT